MDHYDDDNFQDGFDEQRAASRMQVGLWRRLFSYALPYRRDLAALASFSFATAIAEVTFPLITKWVLDDVQANGRDADLLQWGLVYLGCMAVLAIAVAGFVSAAGKIRAYLSHDIREEAFANLQRLSFSFYDHRPVGWLMARMTSDCERLSNILAWGFMDFIWGATTMVGIAGAMLVMQWQLGLLVLAILPVLYWVSVKFRRNILTSARAVRRANSRITGSYNEAIMGVLTSKAFVRERENLGEFQGLTGHHVPGLRDEPHAVGHLPARRHDPREPFDGPRAAHGRHGGLRRAADGGHPRGLPGVRPPLLRAGGDHGLLVRRDADGAGVRGAGAEPDRRRGDDPRLRGCAPSHLLAARRSAPGSRGLRRRARADLPHRTPATSASPTTRGRRC